MNTHNDKIENEKELSFNQLNAIYNYVNRNGKLFSSVIHFNSILYELPPNERSKKKFFFLKKIIITHNTHTG